MTKIVVGGITITHARIVSLAAAKVALEELLKVIADGDRGPWNNGCGCCSTESLNATSEFANAQIALAHDNETRDGSAVDA